MTEMQLLDAQFMFMRLLPKLIDAAHELGYNVTAGELYRTPEQAALNAANKKGIANSLHTKRLAIDLQLFKERKYLTDSLDYAPLGACWKDLHPLARWGGDFSRPDGNHFSIEFGGIK
jgi:hypothetical protein